MSNQRSVTPFEQQVFNLLARDNPPHPVILSQLIASMDLRYITRLRSSIDGERVSMLLCAAAEMHSTATGALANSTFKMNEEASDAAPRSSSENASSVHIAAPTSTTSSGNKIVPQEQVSKAHERHEDENGIANLSDLDPEDEELFESARLLSQAKPVAAIPLPRNHKAKAVTVLTANANDAKDAMGTQEAGEKNAGKQEKKEMGSDKAALENKVQKPQHHPHSPHRSLEELDAELEKMQSEAAKAPAKSGDHPCFGKRS
ncbi:hypothetical protein CB0940_05666 [Cercospora beticola]|uniref:Uncharacterized protein n=1 Tax=Cercospora beticola TaxID=122368 RepID=A0A2G5I064_CERBT|nr:hypothetical protein CB0940_05666 [Cercospora beticola]PIA98176.1 hypothetical protein CB0940_05666 [Cercospora beticola]WPA98237.1 hypothetical protein RHO25_002849 [Cercospora beticola]CAK1359464.1 unnamed protein product [Cercospora beticola]